MCFRGFFVVVFVLCVCLSTDSEPPTNLELYQVGSNSIEINWTPSAIPPSEGYLISTDESLLSGISTRASPYILHQRSLGETITIRMVGRSIHFSSAILGPKSITVQGEETLIISHMELVSC